MPAAVPHDEPMRASDDSHFDAHGPVGLYWLVNGQDFTVCDADGRRIGVVVHVVVDRRRQTAERLIVRRRGLVPRPRYVALDPRAVELVDPDARLFRVPGADTGAVPASRSPASARGREAAVSLRVALAAAARGLSPFVRALDRRLAAVAEATLRLSRRAASVGADAGVGTSAAIRREAPRLAAWLSAKAREAGRVALTVLRRLGVAVHSFARLLGDLSVLAAVAAVAAWRRAEAAVAQQRTAPPEAPPAAPSKEPSKAPPRLPDPHPPEWRRDADAPLDRERRSARSARRTRR